MSDTTDDIRAFKKAKGGILKDLKAQRRKLTVELNIINVLIEDVTGKAPKGRKRRLTKTTFFNE